MFNKKRFIRGALSRFLPADVGSAIARAFDYVISLGILMTITAVVFLAVVFVIGFIWACIQTARVIGA